MGWTWSNLVVTLSGVVAIVGSSLLIRYRVKWMNFVVRQNTAMYGRAAGERMQKAGTTMGVVVPGVGGIIIGCVFVLVGLFGNPQ